MLESETRGRNTSCIIKDHIEVVLLTADAEALAAFRLDLNLNEGGHLLIEAKD